MGKIWIPLSTWRNRQCECCYQIQTHKDLIEECCYTTVLELLSNDEIVLWHHQIGGMICYEMLWRPKSFNGGWPWPAFSCPTLTGVFQYWQKQKLYWACEKSGDNQVTTPSTWCQIESSWVRVRACSKQYLLASCIKATPASWIKVWREREIMKWVLGGKVKKKNFDKVYKELREKHSNLESTMLRLSMGMHVWSVHGGLHDDHLHDIPAFHDRKKKMLLLELYWQYGRFYLLLLLRKLVYQEGVQLFHLLQRLLLY